MANIVDIERGGNYHDVIRRTINEQILYGLDDDQRKTVLYSQRVLLSRKLLEKAAEYARKNNIDVDEFEWELVPNVLSFLDSIKYGLVNFDEKDIKKNFNYWRHEKHPIYLIQKKETPYMDRSEIESAVGHYLSLPFRSEEIDRLLVDILIALELYAYGKEINDTENTFELIESPYAYLKINPLWHFIKGQSINAAFFIGIAAFFIFAGVRNWISETWSFSIAAIMVAIFLIFFVIGVISLPFFWISISKAKRKTYEPLEAMLKLYPEMDSNGPISARHICEGAQKAADSNVVWPAPLFALLDDIIGRTGRL